MDFSRLPSRQSVATRFWTKVNTWGPTVDPALGPCWVWTAGRIPEGYGRFGRIMGRTHNAHRVAWWLTTGKWPDQMVLHKCNGGHLGCVCPYHLKLGDHAENSRDAVRAGRHLLNRERGEKHVKAVLTDAIVLELRRLYHEGKVMTEEARRLGIQYGTARAAIECRTWRHLPGSWP